MNSFASAILLFSIAWSASAAINSCPQSTGSQTINGVVLTTPGPTSAVPGNTLTATNAINGPGLGCTSVDQTFNAFSRSGSILNDGTYLYESPTGSLYDPLANATTLTFARVRGSNAGDGDVLNDLTSASNISGALFYVDTTGNGAQLYSLRFSALGTVIATGGSASFTISVCSGGTLGVLFSTAGACTGAGGTNFQQATFNLTNTTAVQNFGLSFTAPVTRLAVNTSFNFVAGAGATGIGTFSESFAEAPEINSAALVSLGLLGTTFIQRRKRLRRPR